MTTMDISEKKFEQSIECTLLYGGPDACSDSEWTSRELSPPYGGFAPGGYRKRRSEHYDRHLCLDPDAVLDFIYATQPEEWEKLKQQHRAEVKDRFFRRLSTEVARRGTLDVLRKGIKDSGCKFHKTMIQQRAAHFERYCHTGSIHFRQYVFTQVGLYIQVLDPRQVIDCRSLFINFLE